MMGRVVHRGPDDQGTWIQSFGESQPGVGKSHPANPGVAFGFRRLSIIDLAGGHQPITNEDGSIQLIFNGEIYNYRELKEELKRKGHRFRSESDTETIVHLYEDLGLECFSKFNGMFAIALWDGNRRQLVLARDRFGKKPLHYALQNDRLLFASEIKSLEEVEDLPRRIEPAAIDLYMTYGYIPHPLTIYRDIRKLRPGHYAVYRGGQLEEKLFWQVDWNREERISKSQAIDEVRHLLRDSVRLRMRSDVPLGSFLSGGVDSSLIAAIAQQERGSPIKTFSIGFPQAGFDETHHAQRVAEYVGTDHTREEVPPESIEILDRLVQQYDEPFSDSSAIPTWFLSQHTASQVTVALSGDGGDEVFAGYLRYQGLWMSDLTRRWLPFGSLLRSPWIQRLPHSNHPRSFLRRLKRYGMASGLPPAMRYMNWIEIMRPTHRAALYLKSFVDRLGPHDPGWFLDQSWSISRQRDLVTQASIGDLHSYVPCDLMTKVDIASMAHSLEVRQPLLDYRLVEWSAKLPIDLKFRWGKGKLLLREAFYDLIPASIWNRPKMGFGIPVADWFRGPWRSVLERNLLNPEMKLGKFLQVDQVQSMVQQHVSGSQVVVAGYALWNLLCLERWLQLHPEVEFDF